jgi:low temperature requirement protein LtrA
MRHEIVEHAGVHETRHIGPERVSTLELFFDLVFVFTITQVSTIIVQSPDVEGLARAAIQLGMIYWMYDGTPG